MVEQRTENPCVPSSILGPATMSSQSGSSSGVEHNLAKVGVAGSNPVFRSRNYKGLERFSKPFLFFFTPHLHQRKKFLIVAKLLYDWLHPLTTSKCLL